MTLHQKLAAARARLVVAEISHSEASLDVDLYARTILGWDRATLLSEQQDAAPDGLEPTLSEWIARRERREPSAYIVGVREFWGLDFAVTPAVLIPRPETEFIVEEALAVLRAPGHVRIADIGTGSGCVAVALAHDVPGCRLVASDISLEALVVARGNAARHGVADRIEFVATSYLDGVDGLFEVITANPPYVKDGDKPALSPAVRHEPEVALFGGAEGLRDISGVLDTAVSTLSPGGWLVMEFGYGQEASVEALVHARPTLRLDHVRSDLQGIPRTAVIQKRPTAPTPNR
ncbi:MAG: peptide chain release factor N(5)-glutamine methyltransferase [Acidobacteria bacterium]|nr:peptide chain release factor N(5)-glutamine methyltransferase [Acidobacteriota bacterium]